jgi:transcriptional activator SPT8
VHPNQLTVSASQDGSSDNELDDALRDAEEENGEPDNDGDGEMDVDADGNAEGDDDAESDSGGSQGSASEDGGEAGSQPNADIAHTNTTEGGSTEEPRGLPMLPSVRPEVLTAATFDIVPTVAAPQSTSINAIAATADTRWVFSGGSDGYIRRYNWVDSINGKLALTVAQRHPFVDSVVKAGVLMTYWENWDSRSRMNTAQTSLGNQTISPVYSLAVQNQGLWLLAGTESGKIRLQSIRHQEGKEIALLSQHSSAVSQLVLSSDEKSLLSGSWDKTVLDWDLNIGKVRTTFASGTGQISSIEARPISSLPVPQESGEPVLTNGTYASNNNAPGIREESLANGVDDRAQSQQPGATNEAGGSPGDSLFGGDGDDDLFGDTGGAVMTNGAGLSNGYGDEENGMKQDLENGVGQEPSADTSTVEGSETLQPVQLEGQQTVAPEAAPDSPLVNGVSHPPEQPISNGLPHAEDAEMPDADASTLQESNSAPTSDSTFLAASIDGSIRVWDRREPNPIARIQPRNTPPWCLSACWSPDGNYIYAGRRNCTVEEYDLRKGLRAPERIFKFPSGSGAVTSVKAMPNSRHLICASYDILRLYDLMEPQTTRSTVPFLIVPGHRTGVVSQLYIDPACRFMISAGGNRGWEGASTEVLLGYEIGVAN